MTQIKVYQAQVGVEKWFSSIYFLTFFKEERSC